MQTGVEKDEDRKTAIDHMDPLTSSTRVMGTENKVQRYGVALKQSITYFVMFKENSTNKKLA